MSNVDLVFWRAVGELAAIVPVTRIDPLAILVIWTKFYFYVDETLESWINLANSLLNCEIFDGKRLRSRFNNKVKSNWFVGTQVLAVLNEYPLLQLVQ